MISSETTKIHRLQHLIALSTLIKSLFVMLCYKQAIGEQERESYIKGRVNFQL